jgi:8-oxo-dGTP pyrophosphatase MutT (NUDIX family)
MTTPLDRPSARVIVMDETESVLLFLVRDPVDPKPPLWVTPGGGINPGETLNEAAARELSEETGLVIDSAELGDPVATCRGEWTFRGQPLYSVETYFAWRTDRFDLSTEGWEPLEHEVHAAWKWWTIEEIDSTNERVLPALLAEVARSIVRGTIEPCPIELPWINFDGSEIEPAPGSTTG